MISSRQRSPTNPRVRIVLVSIAIALGSIHVPTQSAPHYAVMDLGTLGGSASAGYGIAEFGQGMVGQAQTAAGTYHAFVFGRSGRKDLGTLGGAKSAAFAVAADAIVGQADTASGEQHAFSSSLYSGSTMVDLGTLGGTWSAAYGGEYGSIVGASRIAGNARLQAFVHANGAMTAVPVNRGGDSVARDMADNRIVGYACTTGNSSCGAFAFKDGVTTMLGSLGANSYAPESPGSIHRRNTPSCGVVARHAIWVPLAARTARRSTSTRAARS
jgi:probable HAF family extracellular repeat protein